MIRSCLRCSVRIGATIALLLFTLLGAILLKNFEFQKDLCDPNEGPSQLDVMFARIIRESFVEVAPNVSLHVTEAGPADSLKTILFVHGFPESGQTTWRDQIIHFAGLGYHVIAPDMRGYNTSSKPQRVSDYAMSHLVQDLVSLVATLVSKESKLYLVGHDWGGAVSWGTLVAHPAMFDKAVVMSAPHPIAYAKDSPPRQFLMSWYLLFFNLPATIVNYRLEKDDFSMLASSRVRQVPPKTFSLYDVGRMKQMWSIPGELEAITNYYRALIRGLPFSERDPAAMRVKTPTLILWGAQDFAFTTEIAYASTKYGDQMVARVIPGLGHWLTHEAPATINEEIQSFLEMD